MEGIPPELLADLTDALARGRVCLAELAQIAPDELEAWSAVGIVRLQTGRASDAALLFAALVTVYPYSAAYWRNLGISLHQMREYLQAAAAYRAALVLDPDHMMTLCYLGEVLLTQGDVSAEPYLQAAEAGIDEPAARRARTLLHLLHPPKPAAPPLPDLAAELQHDLAQSAEPSATAEQFFLEDGRSLPLAKSRFAEPAPPPRDWTHPDAEVPITDQFFVAADDVTAPGHPEASPTGAIVRVGLARRAGAARGGRWRNQNVVESENQNGDAAPTPLAHMRTGTDTAQIARPVRRQALAREGTDTAQIDGRGWATALERRRRGPPLVSTAAEGEDITVTDVLPQKRR